MNPTSPSPSPAGHTPELPATSPAGATGDVAASARLFDELPLSPAMQANLRQLGYLQMTPIQAATLPASLAGSDVLARAKTGSGKTAAFALPLLTKLNPRWFAVQAMVLCPTRELADQVAKEIRRLARAEDNIKVLSLCGGTPMRPQIASLEHGAHVVVGTPGRIMDHLQRESLDLKGLNTLVLDEADRMLDMGFFDDIAYVASHCPVERQTMLFSATYPEGIGKLSRQFLRNPVDVQLAETHGAEQIRQRFYEITEGLRLEAVAMLLAHYRPVSTLAFCNTRNRCRELVESLREKGIEALTLHGDLEQHDRDQVLIRFSHRSCSVLVATDVAARGLDIDSLEAVINVDVTPDPEVHVHRIGRTGRAGAQGWALTLATPRDMNRVAAIEKFTRSEADWHPLDELQRNGEGRLLPPMATLQIFGGRKEKIRAGDVLGALTGEMGYTREQIGRITIGDFDTYVSVERSIAAEALTRLNAGKIKGRTVKARRLEGAPVDQGESS